MTTKASAEFHVQAEALPGLAQLLERLADDARAGRDYLLHNTGLQGGEGWFNEVSGAHQNVIEHTQRWLEELSGVTAPGTAAAVTRAAAYYQQTDLGVAAKVDAAGQIGQAKTANLSADYWVRMSAVGSFGDVREPTECYREVPDHHADPQLRYEPAWYDAVSFAAVGRDLVWQGTTLLVEFGWLDRPYDPHELWAKPLIGDWAGIRGCADVLRNLADAAGAMGGNLHHAQHGTLQVWRGNAALSCVAHLAVLQGALGAAGVPLSAMAEAYDGAAVAMARLRDAAGQLINDLIDAIVIFLLEVAFTAASVETVVGPIIGAAAAAYEAYKIFRIIQEIADLYARFDAGIKMSTSALGGFGQLDSSHYVLPAQPAVWGETSALVHLPEVGRT